jgi:hypothetical protein
MIHGHKPSADTVTYDGNGHRIEGQCRQCVHCQMTWEYRPGSGIRRGYCLKHDGFVCGTDACIAQQKDLVAQYERATGKAVSCLAFEEWNDFLMNLAARQAGKPGQDFTISAGGIIVPI